MGYTNIMYQKIIFYQFFFSILILQNNLFLFFKFMIKKEKLYIYIILIYDI